MIKRLSAVFSLILLLLVPAIFPQPATAQGTGQAYVAVVDPGHGGADPGVRITDKLSEKDVTLTIARSVQRELAASKNMRVLLTRNSDRTMTVPERIAVVHAAKADVFVSIHVNAGFGKEAAGYELYFPGFEGHGAGGEGEILQGLARNRSLNDSVRLAQAIERNVETVFPRKGRKLREAPIPILQALGLPGIVIEIGFATNPGESRKLANEDTQRAVAEALARGLRQYFSIP
jgi:N-acetylmuramoyl-L-alanine amidase